MSSEVATSALDYMVSRVPTLLTPKLEYYRILLSSKLLLVYEYMLVHQMQFLYIHQCAPLCPIHIPRQKNVLYIS